jgi:hypothetical protein
MNKDEYRSAISKVKASESFKSRLEASMKAPREKGKNKSIMRLAPAFAALLIVASAVVYSNLPISVGSGASDEFKIISKNSSESACYASILYLDGYEYSPSGWLNYSRDSMDKVDYENIKGEKVGEVTLDLKGKSYTGIPPSFSSTYDVGTEVYTVKNMKKESAVLVVSGDNQSIFYRSRKVVLDEKKQINLTLGEVFNMVSDTQKVSSIELRSEEDASWLGTFEKEKLIALINKELPAQQLLQRTELGQDPYREGKRVPINLVFSDGTALHVQFFPEDKCASVFGGFVRLSEELSAEIQEISKQGNQYPNVSSLLPYKESDISYLKLINHTKGEEVLCENPAWSRGALFSIYNYYRVEEVKPGDPMRHVMTCSLGTSKNDNVTIEFYENSDKLIVIELNGKYYKPIKGRLTFEELKSYLYNSTDLGLKVK